MYRASRLTGKKRIATVGVAVSMFVGAGIAAAADGAPWSDTAPAITQPAPTQDTSTTISPSPQPTAGETETSAPQTEVTSTSDVGDVAADTDTDTGTDTGKFDELPATTTTEAASETTTTPTTIPVQEPTTSAAAEPTTTAATVPEQPATTTSEFHDTPVPQTISLSCSVADNAVSCSWSSPDMPGFARVMLLRGNGGTQGRVPFQSNSSSSVSYIDVNVPSGSYSYVVVVLDGNSHTLVHSNPVYITIGAVG